MVIRIVRMTFREDEVDSFLEIFNGSKEKIRNFEGCEHLELLRDLHSPNVFSTYSFWKYEEDLNNYRKSDLFTKVWTETKMLFMDKPVAQSYSQEMKID